MFTGPNLNPCMVSAYDGRGAVGAHAAVPNEK
jgi:hypothetical protein